MLRSVTLLGSLVALSSCGPGASAKPKYITLPVCQMAREATGLIEAQVTAIGTTQTLSDVGQVHGGRATPVTVTVSRVMSGAAASTVWAVGEVDQDGKAEQGNFKANGSFASGYFFVTEFGDKTMIYGINGYFRKDGSNVINVLDPSGIPESQFLSQASGSPPACP